MSRDVIWVITDIDFDVVIGAGCLGKGTSNLEFAVKDVLSIKKKIQAVRQTVERTIMVEWCAICSTPIVGRSLVDVSFIFFEFDDTYYFQK